MSNPPLPDPAGEQQLSKTSVAKGQLLDAFTKVAPHLPYIVRVMLVGHAWLEQTGSGVYNNNFGGMEGKSASYAKLPTSAVILRSEYEKNPSNYVDWGPGHTYNHKDAATIAAQLARGEARLAVKTRYPVRRPAYASLVSGAAAFVRNIEAKFHKLLASSDPDHQALATVAFNGDERAYAKVVTLRVLALGILPFNDAPDYPGIVIMNIKTARMDLANHVPASP